MELTHIDLFSGIGGFALAAKWAGIKTIQFVEIDPFCQKVLMKNFPGVPIHNDIKTYKYDRPTPFILTGGFPCQPFSVAGKRRGKEDDRYLWPKMLRVISEAKPTWVIGENVAGFISMGLDDCVSDLEREGYEVQPLIIPACAVGAPHRRVRVWIVANCGREREECLPANTTQRKDDKRESEIMGIEAARWEGGNSPVGTGNQSIADTKIAKLHRCWHTWIRGNGFTNHSWDESWSEAATRLCRVDDGIPRIVDRTNRLKSLGNAVVPQIPYLIMKAILNSDT